MNRRLFLKSCTGIGLATLVGNYGQNKHNYYEHYLLDEKYLIDFVESLGYFDDEINEISKKYKIENNLVYIKDKSSEETESGDTYFEYAKNFFQEIDYLILKTEENRIPKEIIFGLSKVITGIISQESKFRLDVKSPKGALGATQVMPINYEEYISEEEFINSFPIQVRESFKVFEKIWWHLSNNFDFNHFGQKYGLLETELNDFIVLCLINSYNTGPGNILKILKRFDKRISKEVASIRKDKTGKGLFHLMTKLAYKYRGNNGWPETYGIESSEYTRLCLGYSKLLGELDDNLLEITRFVSEETPLKVDRITKQDNKNVLAGLSGFLDKILQEVNSKEGMHIDIGNFFNGLILGVKEYVDSILLESSYFNRRDFLVEIGFMSKIVMFGKNIHKNNYGLDYVIDTISDYDIPRSLTNIGDIYEENGGFVEKRLEKYYSKNNSFFPKRSLYDVRLKKEDILTESRYISNYTKRVSPVLEDWCGDDCKKVTRGDIKLGLWKLGFESIDPQNKYWRLYGIGDNIEVKEENSYLRIYGKRILEEIANRFKYKLEESGISKGWTIRPVITSLLRPEEHRIGSSNSVHSYGLGIDISFLRFDLIDTESDLYLDLNKTNNENALVIRDYVQGLMAEVLDELDKEGKIIFTNETKDGLHYHVSALKVN